MPTETFQLELRRELRSGLWVFDDEARGLHDEPLMDDATDVIDLMLLRLGIEGERVLVTFSESEFAGQQEALSFVRPGEKNGFYYYSPTFSREAWLCDELLAYAENAPPTLFMRFDPVAPEEKRRRGCNRDHSTSTEAR